jgi:hypothetical protein
MLSNTNPNPQVDLRRIWIGSSLFNNEGYLYFAWERDSKNGSGVVMFEFQQDPVPAACDYKDVNVNTCNPWANRQAGDFVIVWDQSGSTINIIKRTFQTINNQLVLDAGVQLDPAFVRAATSPDGFFGEAAINLSQTIFRNLQGRCLSIANVIPGTVTGNSDTADYKDTLLFAYPESVVISSCGEVLIRKDAGVGNTGTFPYTLSRVEGGPVNYSGDFTLLGTFTGDYRDEVLDTPDLPVNGFVQYEDVIGGADYKLIEGNLDPGWNTDSIVCTSPGYSSGDVKAGAAFEVKINVLTTCVIVNRQSPQTLKVKKVVVNGLGLTDQKGSDFGYKLVKGSTEETGLTFLDNAAEQTYSLGIGTAYQVVETTQLPGWALPEYSPGCSGTIQAGVDPVCTVTNRVAINDNVNIITRQWVVLQDKAILTNIRRGASETASSVTFKLWAAKSGNVCQTQVGSAQVVVINWGTDTESQTITVGTTTGFVIERTDLNTVNEVRYWTADYSGNNLNNEKTSGCSEITTIKLEQ